MYNPHDTICAISTPPGESALAIVRLSGIESKAIVERFFKGTKLEDRKASFGELIDEHSSILDQVVAIWYKKPKSYTVEDMVEIICHGGYVVSQQIQELLCRHGARLAEPGEFTFRAFINGRIDLTEAEAVNSIIKAKSSRSKKLAIRNLEGKLRAKLEEINTKLFDLITLLEAQIDFSDDEITRVNPKEIKSTLAEVLDIINDIKSTYDIGRISEGRAQIAIVGAPNVGKSSLFNVLLKVDRAIVTEIPGTTRDYLSEYIDIGGYPVILTDTAGVRSSEETVELLGIDRTYELIDDVDLCIFMLDASRPINEDDRKIADALRNQNYILVENKSDLKTTPHELNEKLFASRKTMQMSALTEDGVPELISKLKSYLIGKLSEPSEGVLLSQRQYDCAWKASEAIDSGISLIDSNEPEEIIVSLLREALENIGELTGRVTSEDILNSIFSKFCIGK